MLHGVIVTGICTVPLPEFSIWAFTSAVRASRSTVTPSVPSAMSNCSVPALKAVTEASFGSVLSEAVIVSSAARREASPISAERVYSTGVSSSAVTCS